MAISFFGPKRFNSAPLTLRRNENLERKTGVRRRYWIGVEGLALVLFLSGAGSSTEKELDVPLIPQKLDLWCWAACGQMIMEYHGTDKDVRQCIQARDQSEVPDCCNDSVPQACNQGSWPEFDRYSFTTAEPRFQDALGWTAIKSEISANRPFTFAWGGEDAGHMVVVVGYKKTGTKKYVAINDPGGAGYQLIAWADYLERNGIGPHSRDYYKIEKLSH